MTPDQRGEVEALAIIMEQSPSDEDRTYAEALRACLAALEAAEQERDTAQRDRAAIIEQCVSAERELAEAWRALDAAEAKLVARENEQVPVDCTCPPPDIHCPHHGVNRYTPEQEAAVAAPPDPQAEAVRGVEEVVVHGTASASDAGSGMFGAGWCIGVIHMTQFCRMKLAALRAEGEGGK